MKNWIKYLGALSVVFGVFLLVGLASASTTDILQPAEAIEYTEPVQIHSTLTVDNPGYFPQGVHIGSTEAGVGGVTYFNGTIVNASVNKDGEDVIPVTFGDKVRIDDTVFRGETEGPGDNFPLKLNDDVKVFGDLEVVGNIAYDNSASGLSSTNMQDAIDEISTSLAEAISGGGAASTKGLGELSSSTWEGYSWHVYKPSGSDSTFIKKSNISVTFNPTSATEGTLTATEEFTGGDECDIYVAPCTWSSSHSTRTGTYKIVGNTLLIKDYQPTPDQSPGTDGHKFDNFVLKGDTMTCSHVSGGGFGGFNRTLFLTRQ